MSLLPRKFLSRATSQLAVILRSASRALTFVVALLVFTVVDVPSEAWAHASGETYVWVTVEQDHLHGRFEINVDDIAQKLDLRVSDEETPEQAAHRTRIVHEYLRDNFVVSIDNQPLDLELTDDGIHEFDGIRFVRCLYRTSTAEIPDKIGIHDALFFENDPLHRGLLILVANHKTGEEFGELNIVMMFNPNNADQILDLNELDSLLRPRDFIWQGILHIWIGIDHILFLIALLLPAVLIREEGGWRPVPGFGIALWNVLKIVTVFTIAHSITLGLAALGIVELPSRIVESVIALSIVLVALNTFYRKFSDGSWVVIFGFGLFHGLGFASVMGDLAFRMTDLIKVLLCFNVGVEVGQIGIVAAVFPLIFLFRQTKAYVPVVLRGGSIAIGLMACWWFVERAFAP